MDIYEEAVLNYITSSNDRFVNPQFNIEWNSQENTGGSLPDFVVLDFQEKTIFIVEVSKAYDITKLLSKVKDRKKRWITPIQTIMNSFGLSWDYHITLFLREDRVQYAIKQLKEEKDVSIISLKTVNCFLGNGEFEGKQTLKNT